MKTHLPGRVRQPYFSTGTYILLALVGIGFSFGLARFITGLGAVTNLSDRFPWGIWIAIDVACGVALAAGGFTTAAFVEIFGGRRFKPFIRPAILTAWLGYGMVGFGLLFDLGRYWQAWKPIFHWQGNSVLFEVGMCVLAYLIVLTIEITPSLLEGLIDRADRNEWGAGVLRRLVVPARALRRGVLIVLPVFVIAGVVLSCMHQSSLGTLMVIAPTKLSAFWYTPWLPVLFLLSAIMIGFPMVIIESIFSARSFGREPEMEILEPLARIIPWTIGVYAVFKIATLLAVADRLDTLLHPGCTTALTIEFVAGLAVPFVMLLFRGVRRSPGWLFTASFLLVFGVVLNRLNVFLVGYHPQTAGPTYFPSVGEIAVTTSIIAFLALLYRFFAINAPILTGPEDNGEGLVIADEPPVPKKWAWTFRAIAVASLVTFIGLYATVHRISISHATTARQRIYQMPAALAAQTEAPEAIAHILRPRGYQTAYLMESPVINTASSNFYGPVRFSHRSHDSFTGGDCGVCHHRFSFDDEDRVGVDLSELHAMMDIRLGGPCSSCHGDLEDNTPQSCGHCHGHANEPDASARPGLKGALHRQCIGCHEQSSRGTNAPTTCNSCHHPLVPYHGELMGDMTHAEGPEAITRRCLDCHQETGEDVMRSVHWKWGGHSPSVAGYEHHVDLGLETVLNNYLICAGANPQNCSACHISFGRATDLTGAADPASMDCLICHDTTDTYRKRAGGGGEPDDGVDLVLVSNSVGRPGRNNCGLCHFYSDGGANVKHGDLEPMLANPPPDFDVHMGRAHMLCQDCHRTHEHRIMGRSMTAPASEGEVRCEQCHGVQPHRIVGVLGSHLDNHVRSVACETCHIPHVAKETPTQVFLDYSMAGEDREPTLDAYGMPTWKKECGEMRWVKNLVPTYMWFDGSRDAYVLGEKIDPRRTTVLNAPLGDRSVPAARIAPFKVHTAVQPYDSENNILVTPQLCSAFWDDFKWDRAIADGMKATGLEYSGSYDFTTTVMYSALHHEVVPKDQSLGCADCHAHEAVACRRCHHDPQNLGQPEHVGRTYPDEDRRLDFKKLGYEDDPALIGGRFFSWFDGPAAPRGQ